MTTVNGGGDRTRIAEHVEGIVQGANERGVHLQGEQDWRNYSKWAESITPPRRGARVRLALDTSGFVRELQVLDAGTSAAGDSSRDRQIRRQVAIKTAAQLVGAFAQTHQEVKTEHIFSLADRVLTWIEQGDENNR